MKIETKFCAYEVLEVGIYVIRSGPSNDSYLKICSSTSINATVASLVTVTDSNLTRDLAVNQHDVTHPETYKFRKNMPFCIEKAQKPHLVLICYTNLHSHVYIKFGI